MKYDSGDGWPSFWDVLPNATRTQADYALVEERTEVHCARCGGHLGHIFDDGPAPTHLRYCIDGLALRFVPAVAPTRILITNDDGIDSPGIAALVDALAEDHTVVGRRAVGRSQRHVARDHRRRGDHDGAP